MICFLVSYVSDGTDIASWQSFTLFMVVIVV